jgi:CRISPR-associated exonuclease Cas4
VIDAVEEQGEELVPLEYKKGKMAEHLNDHFQLCAAALCLEERTGRGIAYGEIFYYGNRRRQQVVFTEQLRRGTEVAIGAARAAAGLPMPEPLTQRKKCEACSLEGICLPREVRLLRQGGFDGDE